MTLLSVRSLLAAFALMFLGLAGCGDDGPARYKLEGKVIFQGQPVPAGEIYFTPDTSQGNSGPGSYAMITNGTYATLPSQGIVGGAYVVEILGYTSPPAGEGAEGGTPLFDKYRTNIDFPLNDAEIDLEIPADPG